jgi:transcriptional regulator of met regulon
MIEMGVSMKQALVDPNPPYGEKGEFRKITITVPPEIYERLVRESARRKIAGEPNYMVSAMLREAVSKYFEGAAGNS